MGEQKPGPCPFCKSDKTEVDEPRYGGDMWSLCTDCGATGPIRPTEAEAIAAWDAPGEKIAALMGALVNIRHTIDLDNPESWAADDPHGAMSTAYEMARVALATD